ncbi:MAG TPA: MBL fold metallo-hydrolase [Methanothrix sp.]|nr:MBL fold metallo-hydrolase [Methanothrix sp.]HPJ84036.1 MBL fold metallo-hydrolase [Methanothrix sp.]HPR66055.1 MBL fold metallo-hydrolase [Methanothrix sp.]
MKIEVWTWGTGGPFGRELGVSPGRRRRGHTATSIIISGEGTDPGAEVHVLVDAGAPCVETMIEKGVSAPDLLFITHPHFDHVSDLDRLANSRMRGLMVRRGIRDFERAKRLFRPLTVVGTEECLSHPEDGVRARFGYLEGLVSWTPISGYDVWHSVQRDGTISPGGAKAGSEDVFPLEFKPLPVRHSKHAPGSCLFIFRVGSDEARSDSSEREKDGPRFRNVVVSGDFKSMEDQVAGNPDLRNPACIVLDTNTIIASGNYHASLEENKAKINRWCSGDEEVLVLLNHLSGFGDYLEGYYDHVPDDGDWTAAAESACKPKVTVKIAEDGGCYLIKSSRKVRVTTDRSRSL